MKFKRERFSLRINSVVVRVLREVARRSGCTVTQVLGFAIQNALGSRLAPPEIVLSSYKASTDDFRKISNAIFELEKELFPNS